MSEIHSVADTRQVADVQPEPEKTSPVPNTKFGASLRLQPTQYDFAQIINMARTQQLVCLVLMLFLIHSESAQLSSTFFLLYSIFVILCLNQLAGRWYYCIDGRYDLKQLVNDQSISAKFTYFVALYSPLLIGVFIFRIVSLPPGFGAMLFTLLALAQFLTAGAVAAFEAYEVFILKH